MKKFLLLTIIAVITVGLFASCGQKAPQEEYVEFTNEKEAVQTEAPVVSQQPTPMPEALPTPEVLPEEVPTPTPLPEESTQLQPTEDTLSQPNSGDTEKIIQIANEQVGKPYEKGGKGPDSFDSSGLVYYVLKQSGVDISYMTSAQWGTSDYPSIESMEALQPGDVACFKATVGIYLGDGKMLNASSGSNAVIISENIGNSAYFKENFICGKLVV